MRCPFCSSIFSTQDNDARYCPICGSNLSSTGQAMDQAVAGLAVFASRLRQMGDDQKALLQGLENLADRLEKLGERGATREDKASGPVPSRAAQAQGTLETGVETDLMEDMDQFFPVSDQDAEPSPPPVPDTQGVEGASPPARSGVDLAEVFETPPQPATRPGYRSPRENAELELRVGQKWLLSIGIIIMVLGIGYFLKYSFEQGWIPPWMRVAMAYAWGLGMLGLGELFRRGKYPLYGLYLLGGGIAVLYFATFAGFRIYPLLSQSVAFGLMFATTVLAVFLALRHDCSPLGVLGLLGGFLTPLMLSIGVDNHLALFTYLLILDCGILAVAFYRNWEELNWLGFGGTYCILILWFTSYIEASKLTAFLVFLNLYLIVFCAMPFLKGPRTAPQSKMSGVFKYGLHTIPALSAGITMLLHMAAFGELALDVKWLGLFCAGYMLLFAGMSYLMVRHGQRDRISFNLYTFIAGFFTVLIPIYALDRPELTAVLAVLATVLYILGLRLNLFALQTGAMVLLALVVLSFIGRDYNDIFKAYDDTWMFFKYKLLSRVLHELVILASVFVFALNYRHPVPNPSKVQLTMARSNRLIFISMACGLLFFMLNVECRLFFVAYLPAALQTAYTVLWTLFSVVLMVMGFLRRSKALRMLAIGLFGITMVKLFVVDMSHFSTPWRILSFIVLGLMLVAVSYLYYRYKDRILLALGEQKKQAE